MLANSRYSDDLTRTASSTLMRQNIAAVGWNLTAGQVAKLEEASATQPIYPYWHQKFFKERNPFPTS